MLLLSAMMVVVAFHHGRQGYCRYSFAMQSVWTIAEVLVAVDYCQHCCFFERCCFSGKPPVWITDELLLFSTPQEPTNGVILALDWGWVG